MLKAVERPDQQTISFEYDALGRRTAKIDQPKFGNQGTITRFVWDGNVPLHEWHYKLKIRPDLVVDEFGLLSTSKPEPIQNLITWVFDENSFKPAAKITEEDTYSIITDYLGTPVEMYNSKGEKTWQVEYDIYGKVRKLVTGSLADCPFRYQGQYEDVETGLYYNRFRYYAPDQGIYISQDPIGLHSGEFNFYAFVGDPNRLVDVFGLDCQPRDSKGKFMKKGGDDSMPGKDFEKIIADKLEKNPKVDLIRTQIHVKTSKGDRYMDTLFRNNRTGKVYHGEVKGNSARRSPLQRDKDALIDSGQGTFGTGDSVPKDLKGTSTDGITTIVLNPKG